MQESVRAEKVGLVMIWLSFGYDLLSNAFLLQKTPYCLYRAFFLAQTECPSQIILTVAIALMYHPEVRFFCLNSGIMGGC